MRRRILIGVVVTLAVLLWQVAVTPTPEEVARDLIHQH